MGLRQPVARHAARPRRPDKWYLGAGDGLIYAPPFPQWLDVPGFWDEAHLFQYAVRPLFTVTFIEGGRVLRMGAVRRSWTPDGLEVVFALPNGSAVERRVAAGDHVLRSHWTIRNRGRRRRSIEVVAWTVWPGESIGHDDVAWNRGTLSMRRRLTDRHEVPADLVMRLMTTPRAGAWAAYRSEDTVDHPRFELTPFADRWDPAGLCNEARLAGITRAGLVYAALGLRMTLPARGSAEMTVDAAMELEGVATSRRRGRRAPRPPAAWQAFLTGLPQLASGDPFLDYAWYHRWWGLRLNRLEPAGQFRHPTVCEGIGYFHQPIAYSAPAHAREVRWAHDGTWAHGVLHTFLDQLRADGSMHGRIYVNHLTGTDFYHADWGGAIDAVTAAHPDAVGAEKLYDGLARYARWLLATRDREQSGMIDIVDQYETGQEYMSRYLAVDPDADRYGWENRIRLKGVDATVYAYRMLRTLEEWGRRGGEQPEGEGRRGEDAAFWRQASERAGRAILERMWDPETGMFSDVDPRTGARTGVKAAVCFYPYLTDLVEEEHLVGLETHLFAPREFWTPYPVPSSPADDPHFDPNAEWRGKRHRCPWNGRVWPMVNSHLLEALAHVVRARRRDWAPRFAHFLHRFLRMMTFGGRADRPNAFEHYHPYTGRPSVYRGFDDYQHSWVNDLIVSHVFGFLPSGSDAFVVDPIPIGLVRAELSGIAYWGRRIRIRLRPERFDVSVDGEVVAREAIGEPRAVTL